MDVSDISKTSQNNIPDAKYYLVRPENSEMIFVMDKKPDYEEEPFYNSCKECKLDMNNYLEDHCVDRFDSDNMSTEEDSYLYVLGICPPDNSVAYVFGRPEEAEVDVFKTLTSIDTYSAAEELVILARSISIDVAIHNQLFSDKQITGLDADDIDGFEDAIYPVRPEA